MNSINSSKQIKLGAIISYATTVLSLLLGLIYTPWMISVIGQAQYGLYALAISVSGLLTMDFGISIAVSRFISVFYARGEKDKAHRYLGAAYIVYLCLAITVAAIFVIIYLFIDEIYASLNYEELQIFKYLFAIMAFYSVVSVPFLSQNSVLISNEQFIFLKASGLIQKVLTAVLTILFLLLGSGVISLVAVNAVVNVATIVAKIIFLRTKTTTRANMSGLTGSVFRDFLSYTGWSSITQLWQRVNYALIPNILGIVSGSGAIAIFQVASQMESYVFTISDSLGGLFLPRVANLLEGNKPGKEITNLMIKVGRLQVYIIGFLCLCLVCFGMDFIRAWLGEGFDEVWACSCLIILPSMLTVPQQIGSTALTLTSDVRAKALGELLSSVVCIILGVVLGSFFGATGACAAICVGILVSRLICNVLYVTRLKLNLLRFTKRTYFPWILVALALGAAGVGLSAVLPWVGWIKLCVEAIALAALYFAACWVLLFNQYEKDLFNDLLSKLSRRRG